MRLLIPAICICAVSAGFAADDVVRTVMPFADVTDGVRVIDRRGDLCLVEAPAELLPSVIAPIAPATPARTWTPLRAADPRIQALADAVVWADVEADLQWLIGLGTRYSHSANIHTVADSLEARFASLGLATEQWDFDLDGTMVSNVIATQTGTVHPDSIFVICAHYDATSENPQGNAPGADDNGSGTVAVLTAARLLANQPMGCTVQYVLFGGEEQGLWGSRLWTTEQVARNVNIAGAINFDMIGWWETGVPFDLEIETNAHSRWIADATTDCASTYAGMTYILHEGEDIWWGDHYAFWERGIAAVNHEEAWDWGDPDFNPRYHSTGDLVEHLDPAFTTGNVRVAVTSVATLAGLSGSPSAAAPPLPQASFGAYPNPFNGRTTLILTAPGFEGTVSVGMYDVRGRLLQSVPLTVRDGRGTATIAAVDAYGASLATGNYFVRAQLPGGAVTGRVAYVR